MGREGTFDAELGASEAPSQANEKLMALFEQHACDEDVNQVAPRIIKERTQN